MMTSSDELRKLDGGLLQLLQRPYFQMDSSIPIIVTSQPDDFDELESLIADHDGRIRHVFRPLNAIAAWLPLKAILELARVSYVTELEIDQQVHIA